MGLEKNYELTLSMEALRLGIIPVSLSPSKTICRQSTERSEMSLTLLTISSMYARGLGKIPSFRLFT